MTCVAAPSRLQPRVVLPPFTRARLLQSFTLGRSSKCDVIIDDPHVSSVQFTITMYNRSVCEVEIRDNSSNGTYANAQKVGKNKAKVCMLARGMTGWRAMRSIIQSRSPLAVVSRMKNNDFTAGPPQLQPKSPPPPFSPGSLGTTSQEKGRVCQEVRIARQAEGGHKEADGHRR